MCVPFEDGGYFVIIVITYDIFFLNLWLTMWSRWKYITDSNRGYIGMKIDDVCRKLQNRVDFFICSQRLPTHHRISASNFVAFMISPVH